MLIVVMTILFIGAITALLLINSAKKFEFVDSSPSSVVLSSADKPRVTFEFSSNLPLKQPDGFSISIFPETRFSYGIESNTLIVDIDKVFLEDTSLSITMNNISDLNGNLIKTIPSQLDITLTATSKEFIANLPYVDASVVIEEVSNSTILITSLKTPDANSFAHGNKVLKSNDLNPSLFYIGKSGSSDEGDPVLVPH